MSTTRLLAVCAVSEEGDAFVSELPGAEPATFGPLAGWRSRTGGMEVDLVIAGVGPAAAAAATGLMLGMSASGDGPYDVALNAGIAGAFAGGPAVVGGVVIGDQLIAADLGVVAPEGFLDVETLGFGTALGRVTPPAHLVGLLETRCRAAGLTTCVGPILTLSSFTGTDERARTLIEAHAPAAEAMEGVGMATAAAHLGIPVVELRTISNGVGDRDREAWDLPAALAALRTAGGAVLGASWEL